VSFTHCVRLQNAGEGEEAKEPTAEDGLWLESTMSWAFCNIHLIYVTMQNAGEEAKEPTAEDGPWLFTLDIPSYMPIQSHAKNRC